MNLEKKFRKILAPAGIEINGKDPWDMQVHNPKLYKRIVKSGSLGLGEAYMDGWWDTQDLSGFFTRVLKVKIDEQIKTNIDLLIYVALTRAFNMQSKKRAFQVGEEHYDLGNDLFESMLDKSLVYTCAYWDCADDLCEAQKNKLDLICQKLKLEPGMTLLDIGCGWGQLAKHAAEKYGAVVTGISVSRQQIEHNNKLNKNPNIHYKLIDYRSVRGHFDRVVSVGMFEHVGYKNYREYFSVVNSILKDGGIFLLHTIGGNKSVTSTDQWLHKYIFPNGMIPSAKQIASAAEKIFVLEDWHNFGTDYDKTLMAWHENFEKNWAKLSKSNPNYDQRFYRMWRYYLLMCAATFRARKNHVWQIVFSKNGVPGGYKSIRTPEKTK